MEQQSWNKIEQIIDTVLELDEPERERYIDQVCVGNVELKTKVTNLLESIMESGTTGFLEDERYHLSGFMADLIEDSNQGTASSLIDSQIGSYHILELIGHGGMGSVFLAERADGAYEKKVALKILRRGMDTPSNVARFERERNILARLDHPGIAKLLDGGLTDNQLPYLVMEYIDGDTLYDYCDNHQLSVADRLELFKSVCQAVQHAHKNAIIHRDLKPQNILVTSDGQVKILDFGIAKLLIPDESETTPFHTRTGARMLTRGYAAPEQIESAPVTTATDIYTLGILLYELLTGVHPFDSDDKSLTEFERIIRETTPAHPAKAFQKLPEEKKQCIARQRDTTTSSLLKKLRGDLDAMVMKALRKEPDRRYTTVLTLLDDLKRHQTGRPVAARSGTWRYRGGKFVRRHHWGVGATVAALVLVTGFIVAMGWQIKRTTLQRDRAVATAKFMKNVLSISDPEKGQGGEMPVRALLQQAAANLDTSFSHEPDIKAELEDVIGSAFRGYGLYNQALSLHRKELALRLAEDGPKSLAVADSRNNIGEVFYYLGRADSAAAYYRQSLKVRRRLLGDSHVEIAQSLNNLALIDAYRENYGRAVKRLKKALAIFRDRLPPDHWRIANVLNNLATMHSRQGELQQAEDLFSQAMTMHIRVKGENHRDVARTESSLGSVLIQEGRLRKAETTLQEALRRARASTTDNLPIFGEILISLGNIRLQRGDYAEAERYFRKAHANYLKALPPNHHSQADPLLALARAQLAQGHTSEALAEVRKAVKIDEYALPPGHQRTAEVRCFLGAVLTANRNYAEAEQQLLKSHDALQKSTSSPAKRTLGKVYKHLDQLYKAWGKTNLAAAYSDTLGNMKKVKSGSHH